MSIARWLRRVLSGEDGREHRDKIRREAQYSANESRRAVDASKHLRQMTVADYQYSLRVRGQGRR